VDLRPFHGGHIAGLLFPLTASPLTVAFTLPPSERASAERMKQHETEIAILGIEVITAEAGGDEKRES
jgi:hypothetical protein